MADRVHHMKTLDLRPVAPFPTPTPAAPTATGGEAAPTAGTARGTTKPAAVVVAAAGAGDAGGAGDGDRSPPPLQTGESPAPSSEGQGEGRKRMGLLTEQLIRYGPDDLFFNLHWDIDTVPPAPLPSGTGSELGPGAAIAVRLQCACYTSSRNGQRCASRAATLCCCPRSSTCGTHMHTRMPPPPVARAEHSSGAVPVLVVVF